tara:strand:+ start:2233 stop:2565 length:333 start_codon:yes stop_codon:yes gene_type:complete
MIGDLCLYNNSDIPISKFKLKKNNDHSLIWYKQQSDKFIIEGMKQGISLTKIKESCLVFIELFNHRRSEKKKVSAQDHLYYLNCMLFMIKIGFYDEDDKLQCFFKKKRKQ